MALLSFPASPVNNQLYPVTPVVGQNQYRWDSTNSTWVLEGAATAVTPGCYGDATNVASFCVDAQGRIISALDIPISTTIPDLQAVTDNGAVTTNTVTVAGLIAAGLTYPLADGLSGDTLVTDGAGLLSFVTPIVDDLQTVTDNGSVSTNTVTVAGLIAAGLTYPLADGTLGDVLVTDGGGNLGFVTPPVEDLQTITDNGAVTTNAVTVAGLVAAGLTYPLIDGTLGDVLVTDGSGNLGFVTPPVEDLQTITDNGAVTTNTVTVAGLVVAGLTYPVADGTTGQVLDTDGGGNLGWATVPTVVAVPTSSADPGNDNEVAFDTSGNFYFYKGLTWWKVAGVTF